jgi:hypothetical protein
VDTAVNAILGSAKTGETGAGDGKIFMSNPLSALSVFPVVKKEKTPLVANLNHFKFNILGPNPGPFSVKNINAPRQLFLI